MKLHPFSASIACTVAVFGTMFAGSSAVAATLSLGPVTQYTTTMGTPVDLTAEGTLDWAYWEQTGASYASPLAPTNEKSGASLISSASVFNDSDGTNGTLRGSGGSSTSGLYSFSDGTSPQSSPGLAMAGLVFNSQLGTGSVGDGFTLQITGDPGAERYVNLYLGGFSVTGRLELTLAGVTTVVDTSQTFGSSSPKGIAVYSLRFQPDLVTDLLTVTYTVDSVQGSNANAHVGLEAVTVSNIPEPGSALLLGIGAIALAGKRRRRA